MYLKPSEIFFCQDSINNRFDQRCVHRCKPLGETLDSLVNGLLGVQDIQAISVMQKDSKWFTADNRRLWVFRQFEQIQAKKGIDVQIPVCTTYSIPSSKFTTFNGGTSVRVRGDPGGVHWRKACRGIITTSTRPPSSPLSVPSRQPFTDLQSFLTLLRRSDPEPSPTTSYSYTPRPSDTVGLSAPFPTSHVYEGLQSQSRTFSVESPRTASSYLRRDTLASSSNSGDESVRDGSNNEQPASLFGGPPTTARQLPSTARSHDPAILGPFDSTVKLDPGQVKYTKETISKHCNDGTDISKLPSKMYNEVEVQENIQPIHVYKVFGEHWVVDGNKRLWAFQQLQRYKPGIRIRALVENDEAKFLSEVRKDRPWLTVIDILQMGESVTVAA